MVQKHIRWLLMLALCLTGCRAPFSFKPHPTPTPTSEPATAPTPAPAPQPPPASAPSTPAPTPAEASLKLPGLFSDNMVLQQGLPIPIWGWAPDGEIVTVNFRDQIVSTTAKKGKWSVKLRALKPSTPEALTIAAHGRTIQFTNVVVGDVWLSSGQSNMEWPLRNSFEAQDDIASATNEMIRLFHVPKVRSDKPENDISARWEVCSPDAAKRFSAVAYYFGRDLQQARHVPIGLIESDWGGTTVQAWTSMEGLEKDPAGKDVLTNYPNLEKHYLEEHDLFQKAKAAAAESNQPFNQPPPFRPWKPTELYNGMIAPLIPYGIKGVIWYQGENNTDHAAQYRHLFPDLIQDWRHRWNEGDFAFCCVQLAPFKPIEPQPGESVWAELREAQLLTVKTLPKMGMAVITDIGEQYDVHPRKKAPVGDRLAAAARGVAYGEKIVSSGPIFKNMKIDGDKIILTFDHIGSGLTMHGDVLKGFAICGSDRKWVWALADITGNDTVSVSSPNISSPVAVRYGWADYPVVNLWNREGLPASPFRTDNFPMITEGK